MHHIHIGTLNYYLHILFMCPMVLSLLYLDPPGSLEGKFRGIFSYGFISKMNMYMSSEATLLVI